jgi:hypothetical protein
MNVPTRTVDRGSCTEATPQRDGDALKGWRDVPLVSGDLPRPIIARTKNGMLAVEMRFAIIYSQDNINLHHNLNIQYLAIHTGAICIELGVHPPVS